MQEKKVLIDSFMDKYFSLTIVPDALYKSMTYSLSAGGKRIRPILCLASYEACGGKADDVVPYASAFELIHTYSLIHGDLPGLDGDELRRGKATNHKGFGGGIGVLAGDGPPDKGFYLLS